MAAMAFFGDGYQQLGFALDSNWCAHRHTTWLVLYFLASPSARLRIEKIMNALSSASLFGIAVWVWVVFTGISRTFKRMTSDSQIEGFAVFKCLQDPELGACYSADQSFGSAASIKLEPLRRTRQATRSVGCRHPRILWNK